MRSHAERGNDQCPCGGTINRVKPDSCSPPRTHRWTARLMRGCTPVIDRSHAPRGNAAMDAPRPLWAMTQSVIRCIPTQSVGTISAPAMRSSYRSFPRSAWECSHGRSASALGRDAERHQMHSHAERGNDQCACVGAINRVKPGSCSPPRTHRWIARRTPGCVPVRLSSAPDGRCRICASGSAAPVVARRSAG